MRYAATVQPKVTAMFWVEDSFNNAPRARIPSIIDVLVVELQPAGVGGISMAAVVFTDECAVAFEHNSNKRPKANCAPGKSFWRC